MAEFMALTLDTVEGALQKYLPDLLKDLDPIAEYKRGFTAVMPNPPTVWLTPTRVSLGDEGATIDSQCFVTVTIGIVNSDRDVLTGLAIAYVKAIDAALRSVPVGDIGKGVMRIWIVQHDYGPLRQVGQQGFGVFPSVHLQVDQSEIDEEA